ncbi:MAG: cobalamin biosynthesis protein [Halioglobus sp.]|nr:cobalamin biosynthesis protein [Halioglobus sp.]
MTSLNLLLALLADRIWGEAPRCHPLVGFGRLANWLEQRARQSMQVRSDGREAAVAADAARQRWYGLLCWTALVIPPTALLWLLQGVLDEAVASALGIIVLYFCIGWRSLREHANAVAEPLARGDLAGARVQLARIVSRDTAHLDAPSVARATVESVLENGSDAVLAPVFWFAVAGAPGALCYRLANTLDAMWGYRNARYLHFGRAAARLDDALNWLPARCCALSYALVGRRHSALHCWRTQAAQCDSPNAGPVMAAGAGALGIVLGGPARYGHVEHWRPELGQGRPVQPGDIGRGLSLLDRAIGVWVAVLLGIEVLL